MTAPFDNIPGMRGPNPGVPQIARVRNDTFVTFRPLESCPFCRKMINDEKFVAPAEELVCPHVRRTELEALMTTISNGEGEQISLTVTTLASGLVQVTLTWNEFARPKEAAAPQRPGAL